MFSSPLQYIKQCVMRQGEDDEEIQRFVDDIAHKATSSLASFHSLGSWQAVHREFERRQQSPLFEMVTIAQWRRNDRVKRNKGGMLLADKRRIDARASVVRSLPDEAVGRRPAGNRVKYLAPLGHGTSPETEGPNDRMRVVPTITIAHLSSVGKDRHNTFGKRSQTEDDETSYAQAPVSPTASTSTKQRGRPRLVVTPRTLSTIAASKKPETHADGIVLLSNILESHYRHRNNITDDLREKNSAAFKIAERRNKMASDLMQRRSEYLVAFLRFAQRVNMSEWGTVDESRLTTLYEGFYCLAKGIGKPTEGCGVVHDDECAAAYLSLASTAPNDDIVPFQTFLQSSATASHHSARQPRGGHSVVALQQPAMFAKDSDISAVQAPTGEAPSPQLPIATGSIMSGPNSPLTSRKLHHLCIMTRTEEVFLRGEDYKAACHEHAIPVALQLFARSENISFLEIVKRILPNSKGTPDVILQMMRRGVIPLPRWVRDTYADLIGLCAPLVEGDHRSVSPSKGMGRRTISNVPGSVQHGHHPDSREGQVRVVSREKGADDGTANDGGAGKRRGASPLQGSKRSGSVSLVDEGDAKRRPSDVTPLSTIALCGVTSAELANLLRKQGMDGTSAAAIVQQYDANEDGALNEAEFVAAVVGEEILRACGRW